MTIPRNDDVDIMRKQKKTDEFVRFHNLVFRFFESFLGSHVSRYLAGRRDIVLDAPNSVSIEFILHLKDGFSLLAPQILHLLLHSSITSTIP